ncbi:MAG: 2-amino-4-hydroxy-6-hydroxymethyldihydropteridine diphosphokinase [Thermodesulfobacteriota bacterium]
MNRAVISVGSNISPEKNIKAAEGILAREQDLIRVSTFIRTAPVPPAHGDDYLNGAFLIETPLTKKDLEVFLKGVERRLGRKRGHARFAPRTMDLDIIVFNGAIIDDDYYKYGFVQEAVKELLPELSMGKIPSSGPS